MGIDFNSLRKKSMENRESLTKSNINQCIKKFDKEIYNKSKEGSTYYSILVGSLKDMIDNEYIFEDVLNSIISHYKQQGANVYIRKYQITDGFNLDDLVIDWSNA